MEGKEPNRIQVSSGVQEFDINGNGIVKFNPADTDFLDRLFAAFDEMELRQAERRSKAAEMKGREFFDYVRKMDEETRELIDGVFNAPICEMAFPGLCLYSLAEGLPLWCNLMLAIFDEIDAALDESDKKARYRIDKYTKKYEQKRKK